MGTNKHNTLQVAHSTSYTLQLLEDTGFLACKPASIPMDHNINLTSVKDSPLADASKYRRLIGQLLYLTTTRPDITFAVHKLSQFIAEPHQVHLNAAHQVLHYLKNSPGQSLFYSAASKHTHKAFSDWASCLLTRRSTTGFCVFLGNSLIYHENPRSKTLSQRHPLR